MRDGLFEAGEPICQLVPMRRGELESFQPSIAPISATPGPQAEFNTFRESRLAFRQALDDRDPKARAEGWQKDYVRGMTPAGTPAPEHQTRLQLRPSSRSIDTNRK